jgi:hypothetical protein
MRKVAKSLARLIGLQRRLTEGRLRSSSTNVRLAKGVCVTDYPACERERGPDQAQQRIHLADDVVEPRRHVVRLVPGVGEPVAGGLNLSSETLKSEEAAVSSWVICSARAGVCRLRRTAALADGSGAASGTTPSPRGGFLLAAGVAGSRWSASMSAVCLTRTEVHSTT